MPIVQIMKIIILWNIGCWEILGQRTKLAQILHTRHFHLDQPCKPHDLELALFLFQKNPLFQIMRFAKQHQQAYPQS
jgi:hypothetical protein